MVPPEAVSVPLYGDCSWPLGRLLVVTSRVAGATVMERAFVAVCAVVAESNAWTVKDAVPEVVGVPEITPVEAFKLRPAGSAPALMPQVYGVVPPEAASVAL